MGGKEMEMEMEMEIDEMIGESAEEAEREKVTTLRSSRCFKTRDLAKSTQSKKEQE
jgi:hypothetical protein